MPVQPLTFAFWLAFAQCLLFCRVNGEKLTPWSGCANDQPCLPEGQSIEMFKKLPFPIPVESSTYRNPGKSFVFDTSAEPQISLLRFFFRKRYLWSSTDIVLEVFFLKTISLISRRYRFWRLLPENDIFDLPLISFLKTFSWKRYRSFPCRRFYPKPWIIASVG